MDGPPTEEGWHLQGTLSSGSFRHRGVALGGERCVSDIAGAFSCERTTISKRLSILRMLDIIEDRREGLNVFCRMRMYCLTSVLSCGDAPAGGNGSEDAACPLLERRNASSVFVGMREETARESVPRKFCEGKSGRKMREDLRS